MESRIWLALGSYTFECSPWSISPCLLTLAGMHLFRAHHGLPLMCRNNWEHFGLYLLELHNLIISHQHTPDYFIYLCKCDNKRLTLIKQISHQLLFYRSFKHPCPNSTGHDYNQAPSAEWCRGQLDLELHLGGCSVARVTLQQQRCRVHWPKAGRRRENPAKTFSPLLP